YASPSVSVRCAVFVRIVSSVFVIGLPSFSSPAILTRRRRTGKSRKWSLASDKRHRDVDDVGLLPISRESGTLLLTAKSLRRHFVIKILIAEDMHMIRGALVALLRLEADFDVVAELDRGDAIVETALKARPDVAVIDIDLPGLDGLSAAASLRE